MAFFIRLKTNYFITYFRNFIIGASLLTSQAYGYEVYFEGVRDPETKELLESVSQLIKLKDKPPATLIGLKRRIDNDKERLIEALHSLGYYEATVAATIQDNGEAVLIHIAPHDKYHFATFNIRYLQLGEPAKSCETLPTLEALQVGLGEPALPKIILEAEEKLLDQLNLLGYAFATIEKRDVVADQQAHSIHVTLDVELGPLTHFGPVKINGLERVKECFILKKLKWQEGDIYNPLNVEKTQEALELSGLFKSINITHAEKAEDNDLLPVEINVVEGKQRSIGFGVNYMSELGPGLTAEWEDRNFAGEGERLSTKLDLWQDLQNANVTYLIPDFHKPDRNLIWEADYHYEKNKAFIEKALSFSGTIDTKLSDHLRFSYGGMYKIIRSQRSERNGTFDLIKIPLQLRWTTADSLLEPTKGITMLIKSVPSLQIRSPQFAYCINSITASSYHSLTKDKKHVFATKLMVGSIFGGAQHDIPPPERFYAGSESALRGYRYLTVSPLAHHDKPIGGRSLLISSFELRNRINDKFGWTLFYEVGNVYKDAVPNFKEGFRQSAGVGLRYYTPVGPLRLDVAVPLNPRKIDRAFEVYFSIGQSF